MKKLQFGECRIISSNTDESENNYCVYCHTNIINGKKYIGQTKYGDNPKQRWRYGTGYQQCDVFYKAIKKYGWNNFKHEILLDGLNRDEANYYEEYYIKYYHTCVIEKGAWGYNATYGGENHAISETTKDKLRRSTLKLWEDKEYREKATRGRKGRKHSQETKKLISNILSGRALSESHKQKLSKQKLGKPFSEEHKQHLSEKSAHSKKVKCIETGEVFNSCAEAAKAMNMSINSRTHISRVCRSIERTAGIHPITHEKLHWEYLIEQNETGDFITMNKTNALLLSDTYKACHPRMYPKGLTKLVSYWVPRRSMLKKQDKMVFFGLQAFIKEYLMGYFKDNFFDLSEEDVVSLYTETMNIQIGEGNYDLDKIVELHRLGYLPLEIRALPEGTLVAMGIPCIEITNTKEEFAWLVQWIECILQVELWKPCCHATIGYMYRKIADYWYEKTTDGLDGAMACADFGMRGMSCMDEAVRCSASWLLSFNKTSTIPAINYLDKYYNADCKNNSIGIGAVSTEHSVMGANFSIDGDEITFVKRLLTELYPNTSFSMVSDTYDYWNMINNILPQCKKEIMNHNGKLLVRPDSGNIVEISVKTVERLWEIFGGTENSKGYKVLDPHIGIIYGDGCTLSNVETIWKELEKRGFAANNIAFGVGAFCFTAIVEDGNLVVSTRDIFGIAMKATYGVIDGKKLMIYKDPKTDTSHLKKSHKGCCRVFEEDGELKCQDQLMEMSDDSLLTTVFKDGEPVREDSFMDIRERMYGGK